MARILKKAVTIVDGEVTAGTLLSSENYLYDAFDRLYWIIYADGGNNLIADVRWTYDNNENITSVRVRVMENGTLRTQNYSYTYNDDKQPESTTYGNVTETFAYDAHGRTASRTVQSGNSTVLSSGYGYIDIGTNFTTTQVYSVTNTYGNATDSHTYTYDENGNIVSDSDGTNTVTYEYDSLNQLTLETNDAAGKAWAYTYDLGGNILTKTEYDYSNGQTSNPVTVSYIYGDTEWHDLLTSWNNQTITYDGMGNPTSYRGWTMTWQGGRQLAGMTNGTDTLSFAYNECGLRTEKTVNNVTRSYVWNSSQLLVDRGVDDTLYFHYNANGEMIGYTRKTASGETECFLVKNQQGDVEKVISADGTVLAAYTYDAWGNILSATGSLANANPIRYRGYYFDSETGLYYLHSRYYDPEVRRFINADDAAMLGGDDNLQSYSLFAYCGNNPVNNTDSNGNLSLPNWAKVAIGVGIIATAVAVTVATGGAAAGPVAAAVHCIAAGAANGAIIGAATGTVSGAAMGAISHRLTTGSWAGAGQAAVDGAATGFMSGAATGAITGALTSPFCFVAGTAVLTSTGAVAIEKVRKGNLVWAWNEDTGEIALRPVVETYINETDELVHIYVNGEEIITTPGHPFYSPVKGWTDALHLCVGDILVLVNREYAVVENVQHELLKAPINVYNFNVDGYHTYYVSSTGVLVHNTCHGNSLSTTKKTDLYVLRDKETNIVKKIGETTRGVARYSNSFYESNNVYMHVIDSGSKRAMHYQQHRLLSTYLEKAGELPLLNKSLW